MTLAVKVEIRGVPGAYQLFRDGQPYIIRGAGVDGHDLQSLKACGGNSVRTWRIGNGSILDQAHELGMTVALGLEVIPERHGFDYNDKQAVAGQLENLRQDVMRYKDHPALLCWLIGNELNLESSNPAVYDAVGSISRMIHELDGNHPTATTTAGLYHELLVDIYQRAPDLDFVGVQVYGGLPDLPRVFRESGVEIPMMVTEWGTVGHWEVPCTDWGAPIELNSSEKADRYHAGYTETLNQLGDKLIGNYVFLWGQKQERTPTWYGMFTAGGEPTEVVDTMQYLWTGQWPKTLAPTLKSLLLDGRVALDNIRLNAGDTYTASVLVAEPDKKIHYGWSLLQESESDAVGGDHEDVPKNYSELITDPGARHITLTAPQQPGAYRLFVYVIAKCNKVAHANIPFLAI